MKRIAIISAVIVILILVLAACGGSATEEKPEIGTVAEYDSGIAELQDAEFYTADDGSNRIRVNIKYTNPSADPCYLLSAFAMKAFQNGKEIEDMAYMDINTDEGRSLIQEVKDGASVQAFRTFKLDDNSPVEVWICTPTANEDLLAMQTYSAD